MYYDNLYIFDLIYKSLVDIKQYKNFCIATYQMNMICIYFRDQCNLHSYYHKYNNIGLLRKNEDHKKFSIFFLCYHYLLFIKIIWNHTYIQHNLHH